LCTAIVEKRIDFMNYLRENKIESGQIHYRNDRYSVLGGRREDLPMMDAVEDKYIVLPLNNHLSEQQIEYVCDAIKKGW
jgi:perosamine synthetase